MPFPWKSRGSSGKGSMSGSSKKLVKELEAAGITRDAGPAEVPVGVKTQIIVNVYNLMTPENNQKFGYLGVGIYHSGVVVHGKEWSFAGSRDADVGLDVSGVFSIVPKTALPAEMLHSSIVVGETSLTEQQVAWILTGMSKAWTMRSYHVLSRNCNHFSEEFLNRLSKASGTKFTFPAWINRAAKLGDMLLPNSLLEYIMRSLPQPPPEAPPPRKPQCCHHHHPPATQPTEEPLPPIPEDLNSLTVRQLRTILFVRKIDWKGCIEKTDMVAKIKEWQREHEK
eukprot:TRINITY_DN2379_c0_g1_i1.p1 TRINITY_DN2379_c0_g1~~TRINITY_DN2379_c0_g1_i1.p1  ORF type:complete len:282 (+),score=53.93 TRINITY_DN2379_c0_g1_i1:61-906(+)